MVPDKEKQTNTAKSANKGRAVALLECLTFKSKSVHIDSDKTIMTIMHNQIITATKRSWQILGKSDDSSSLRLGKYDQFRCWYFIRNWTRHTRSNFQTPASSSTAKKRQ